MKKIKISLLTVFALLVVFSCDKDDDTLEESKTNSELIIGTWRWTASSENGEDYPLNTCDLLDTLTFNGTEVSGVSNSSDDGDDESCTSDNFDGIIYSINNNIINFTIDDVEESTEIVTLNDTTLVIKNVDTYNDGTTEVTDIYTDTYTRQ